MSLPFEIKEEALRLGFILAGITTPEPPPHLSVYRNWLGQGRHGSMGYLAGAQAIQRRSDPRLILPECRSILVLAVRYANPASAPSYAASESGLSGKVAAYAWGEDYHVVLVERLKALARFVEANVGHSVPHRYYTDTGPLLERELAQRAGLGWIGKNTCLINPHQGSYFLLAELLLGLDLEPDPPFLFDRCGNCTRCLQACPTACILPDRTIDARRCISYLTIEEKGSIPPELRPQMRNWVFGCDVCQMVCPWNRFSVPQFEPAFAPSAGLPRVDLRQELGLSPQEFNRKFKRSPVQRVHRRGYLRNVTVALGNSRDPQALPPLRAAADTDDPLIREHALWSMEQILKP